MSYHLFSLWQGQGKVGETRYMAGVDLTSYELLEYYRDRFPGCRVEYEGEIEGNIEPIKPAEKQ